MDADPMFRSQFADQFIQRQIPFRRNPLRDTILNAGQFAVAASIALRAGSDRTSLSPEPDQIIHEFWGNPEMPGRFAMTMPLIDKRDHPLTQLTWMWFTHLKLPYLPQ
jgi:hypothetical protein